MVELIIVVGIIALLTAIVVPVTKNVIAAGQRAASTAQLRNIEMAIIQYQQTFKAAPGFFREEEFEGSNNFTSTENLVLSLIGGAKDVNDDFGRRASGVPDMNAIKGGQTVKYNVDLEDLGKGPVNALNGRSYGAFYAYTPEELGTVQRLNGPNNNMPELLDTSTGMPILYYRFRKAEPGQALVVDQFSNQRRRVAVDCNNYYIAEDLQSATGEEYPNDAEVSMIHPNVSERENNFARIFRDNKLSEPLKNHINSDSVSHDDPNVAGSGNVISGDFALVSPGPDKVYFNKLLNRYLIPGRDNESYNPQDSLDDIVMIGGAN
jgi:type II secretory pathway pseudopilin PulG